MSSQRQRRRWDRSSEKTRPFGMSFVDLVASALICVVALLILWLQFIDPMGLIPGRRVSMEESLRGAQVAELQGTAALGLQVALTGKWKSGPKSEKIDVTVGCDGIERRGTLAPNDDRYAGLGFGFEKVTDPSTCFLRASQQGQGASAKIVARATKSGAFFYQSSVDLVGGQSTGRLSLLDDGSRSAAWEAVGEPPQASWKFRWAPVAP